MEIYVKQKGIAVPLYSWPGFWRKCSLWERLFKGAPKYKWVPPMWGTLSDMEKRLRKAEKKAADQLASEIDRELEAKYEKPI